MLRKLALCFLFVAFESAAPAQSVRHFTFHYGFTIKEVPAGGRVRVWFPAAHSDLYQEVHVVSATGDLSLKKTRESRFGNEIYYAESSKAKPGDLRFEVVYNVVRHEHLTLGLVRPRLENAALSKKESEQDLAADQLVPITGLPAELAVKVTAGKTLQLDKARAIYN